MGSSAAWSPSAAVAAKASRGRSRPTSNALGTHKGSVQWIPPVVRGGRWGRGGGVVGVVWGGAVGGGWLAPRRGLVTGLVTARSATGQLVFLPLLAQVSDNLGWRMAVVLVCGALGLATLAMLALIRDRPADVGLQPFGQEAETPAPAALVPRHGLMTAWSALRDASRTGVFWVLFRTFFICGASSNGLIQTHFVPLCADFGLPAVGAARLLAAMGLFDIAATLGSGWLSDPYATHWSPF